MAVSDLDRKIDYLGNTKSLIRIALQNKGVTISDDETFREYADDINNLELAQDQSDATAISSDIAMGKKAYNNNNLVIGTIPQFSTLICGATSIEDKPTTQKVVGKCDIDAKVILNQNGIIRSEYDYNSLASAIGLSAEILKKDVVILGITGTGIILTPEEYSHINQLLDTILGGE